MVAPDMLRPGSWWRRLPFGALVVGATLSLVYLYFFALQAHVEIDIKMFDQKRAWFKVYWTDDKTGYGEDRMRRVLIDGKKEQYQLFIGNLGDISKLRIDPVEHQTKLLLRSITISQQGFRTIRVSPQNEFKGLSVVQDIGGVRYKEDGLRFLTEGRDPQFELTIDKGSNREFPLSHIVIVLLIMGSTIVVARTLGFLVVQLGYVPALLTIAVLLALVMAVISRDYWLHPNGTSRLFVHPDEQVHTRAIEHYRDHWLPPAVDDPAIADSYSIYGYTRLASFELYYPIAGYFTRLVEPFRKTLIWDARLFGVILFGLMAWLAWRQSHFRPIALPLLLTPQIWYLFSYANSDGFALVLATLAAWQACAPDSRLNRILREPSPTRFWFHLAWLGGLAGALFLLKLNFYFFILFLGGYFLLRLVRGDFPDYGLFFKRLTLIGLVGLSVYGARVAVDISVNGFDASQKRQAMVEEMARPLYKPSTELNRKHIYLYMKERGVSLGRMIQRERWGGKTWISSFGAYGYTQYLGGPVFYQLAKMTGLVLIGVLFFSALIYGSRFTHWLFALTSGTALLLIAASFWNSWTVSFQAQGRYFAPILPMVGVFYYHMRGALEGRLAGTVVNALVLALFALSVYSFVYIGLALIPKFA